MISGVVEVNKFAKIRLILEVKFGDEPLLVSRHYKVS